MWVRLRASIIKEFILFWRDPTTRRVLFVMPLIQVVIFGFAATMEVRNIDLLVVNRDTGRWAADFIARANAAQFTADIRFARSTDVMEEEILDRQALMGLVFPADFSRKIVAGEAAEVQVIVDGRRANTGQVALTYLREIANNMSMELSGVGTEAAVVVRNWFNPNLNYRWFIVPSLAASLSLMVAMMMTSLSIAREREMGTFDQVLVSPSSPIEILASKTIPAVLGGCFVGLLAATMAVVGFQVPFRGNALLLLGALPAYMFSGVGIGLTVSALSNTQQQATLGMFFLFMPIMLTSGFVTPVENMPPWLQVIAQANPMVHFLAILHGLFLKSMSGRDVLDQVMPLLMIGAVTFSTATLLVRRRLQ